MRVEISRGGKANIVLTKEEWERYGNSMGWKVGDDASVKTASAPSIRIVQSGDSHEVVMNKKGWEYLGKKAQFYGYDEDDDFVDDGFSEGERELYSDDFDDLDEEDGEEDEDYLSMLDDIDIDEDLSAEDEAEQEAFESTIDALGTATIGITDRTVPSHGVPYMIVSALEPISEFRDIDMTGDPTQAISDYLGTEPKNDSERRVMEMIREALAAGGMSVGEDVI